MAYWFNNIFKIECMPLKDTLSFHLKLQRISRKEHHSACTIAMNTREAKSGAGETKNEMGGCTEGSEA